MHNDYLIFGAPFIDQDEIEEIVRTLRSGWIGTGPRVKKFEENFKLYKKAKNAVAVSSCTAALHLSLLASQLKPGDEVILPSMTFCATVNAIIHSGATPVLADVEPRTMNIDPNNIQERITQKTKAILPVHFAGRPCNMNEITDIARLHNLMVIEDCAHAIESKYKGKHCGTFGAFGCFSFYVTKNITTGEGGMVICNNEEQASHIKIMALHGLSKDAWSRFSDIGYKHYFVTEAGFKCNMTDIQAALGIHQLEKVDQYWERRQEIWKQYNEAFSVLPVTLPEEPESDTKHAFHLYTLLIDKRKTGISRDDFLDAMHSRNIGTGVHYLSVPEHPYYQERFGWRPENYPNAMTIGRETVSLPLSAKLTNLDVQSVIETVNEILAR
jgi:dTDP-4-amino-4,6-dideoxygalactose transaminase